MSVALDFSLAAMVTGLIATLLMDIWTFARKYLMASPSLDYAMVGRWIAHMRHGRFRHVSIAEAPPMQGERIVGWVSHYVIGIVFAGLLLAVCGTGWIARPTLLPALLVGTATLAAPFFLMQPCMGAGVAASRTHAPCHARLRSLVTHMIFGVGLYAGGWLTHMLLY
ncbi:DUF2938 domain-containing protein [Henriciella sp.]|uniref:DUF2938 domain-containing protein n=1 Tax=Henriciella sp. TaxID=1968823 RepID=UPI00263508D1|nr:DUF2938 domain-containing protein [Henriciella sp.]